MHGALNLHRVRIIAISGAVILHAAAFSAFAFAHLGGETVAFDGAPVISVSIADAPPQSQPAPAERPKPLKIPEPAERANALVADAGAISATAPSPSAAPTSALSARATPPGGGAEANAYAKTVWSHLALYRPRSVTGARQARISFKLDPAGALLSVSLLQSSGSDAFDRACLQAVRRAAPFPPPPPALDEGARIFDVAITTRTR